MKAVIVLALLGVLGALGSAGYFMLRGKDGKDELGRRMAKSLAWRVGLSVAVFAFILLSWYFGWIKPTGITAMR